MTPEELADLLRQSLAELDGRESLPQHVWIAALNRVNDQAREAGLQSDDLRFELFAAEVTLNDAPAEWGTLFGPTMTMLRADQTRLDVPPLLGIDAAAVDYWTRRMEEATHPLMRARYADLVWDLSQTVANRRPPIRAAHLAIDSYVEAVATNRCEMHDGYGDYMRRPVALAASVNDQVRLAAAIARLDAYAAGAPDDDEREFRQRELLDLLTDLLPVQRRPAAQMQGLIAALRARLEALAAGEPDHFTLGNVALPLADFYRDSNQLEEAQAVLRTYGAAVIRMADQAMAILGIAWLRGLHGIYTRFQMNPEAVDILARIEARQREVPGNLAPVRIPMEVNAQELEDFLAYVITDDLAESVARLAVNFVPDIEEQRQQMAQLAIEHPLAAAIPGILVAHDGREIAHLGGDDADTGRLMHHLSQGMGFIAFHLRHALARFRERHAPDAQTLFDYCIASAVWPPDRHGVLRRGIEAFLVDDHVVAIHLLVTELENTVRNIARTIGVPLQRPNRFGGLDLRTFGDLLADEQIRQCLSENVATYMESVLTDQRGWNIRNTTCHGIRPFASFHSAASDRVMHIVLLLSLLRPVVRENAAPVDEPIPDPGAGEEPAA